MSKNGSAPDQPRPGPTLDAYVALEASVTQAHVARGAFSAPDASQEEERVARSRAYARWRWKAYMAGEVHSL